MGAVAAWLRALPVCVACVRCVVVPRCMAAWVAWLRAGAWVRSAVGAWLRAVHRCVAVAASLRGLRVFCGCVAVCGAR